MSNNLVRLEDVAEFINGRAFKPSDWSTSGLPIIRIQNLTGTNEIFNYFDGDIDDRIRVRRGDLLISWSASLGVYRWQGNDAALNQHIFKVRLTEGVDPDYFFYVATNAVQEMVSRVHGSTMQHITKDRFESIHIRLPGLSEQRQIAGRLARADRLRRTRRYALELTDAVLPAAFREFFGDLTNPSKEVCTVELGDYLAFVTTGSRGWAQHYSPAGSRFIRSLDVRMNYISDDDAVYVVAPLGAEADRTRVRAADVLLTVTGSQIGRVAPVPEGLAGSFISQHVAILRLKPGLLPVFLAMFLSMSFGGQREIARLQYGQTKPGLNLDQVREFRILLPSPSLQQRFVTLVERLNGLRGVQREVLRQAEHLFASLLYRAFSG